MCEFKTFLWSGVKQKEYGHVFDAQDLHSVKEGFHDGLFFENNCCRLSTGHSLQWSDINSEKLKNVWFNSYEK